MSSPSAPGMLLLLLPLAWAGSLQKDAKFQLHVQRAVTVQEGLCALVPCTFSYPQEDWRNSDPVHGEWLQRSRQNRTDVLVATSNERKQKHQKSIKPSFHLGDPAANSCTLNITGAQKNDSGVYYFRLEKGQLRHPFKSNPVTVTVAALTQHPDIHMETPLESGHPSRLTCSLPGSCDGAAPPTISWMGAALRPTELGSEASNSSELLLTPRPQDHGTSLTCRVSFPRAGVSTERTLMLNVTYAPQSLTVGFRRNCTEWKNLGNGSSLSVLEGESLHLLCVTDSNPPASLRWAWGSRAASPSQLSSSGLLELPQVEAGHHGGTLTCQAQHPRGSLQASLHLSVQRPPRLLGPSCSREDEGLRCTCASSARPAPSLRWRLGEQLLEGNSSDASFQVSFSHGGSWANSSLSLRGGLSSDLSLSCEAQNPHGTRSAALLLLRGGAGGPELGRGFVLGAVGGAGTVGLLALCLCLVFFLVKSCKKGPPKKAPVQAAATSPPGATLQPPSPESRHSSGAEPLPAAATPTSEEEQELHYASLSFLGLQPRQPLDQDATSTTEYSEIMTGR